MTHDTYDARAAVLRNSAEQVESARRHMSRIIPRNRQHQAYFHCSPSSVKDDVQSKVAQVTNNDNFIVGRDHNLEQ
jgi:hypothetical protein